MSWSKQGWLGRGKGGRGGEHWFKDRVVKSLEKSVEKESMSIEKTASLETKEGNTFFR